MGARKYLLFTFGPDLGSNAGAATAALHESVQTLPNQHGSWMGCLNRHMIDRNCSEGREACGTVAGLHHAASGRWNFLSNVRQKEKGHARPI